MESLLLKLPGVRIPPIVEIPQLFKIHFVKLTLRSWSWLGFWRQAAGLLTSDFQIAWKDFPCLVSFLEPNLEVGKNWLVKCRDDTMKKKKHSKLLGGLQVYMY